MTWLTVVDPARYQGLRSQLVAGGRPMERFLLRYPTPGVCAGQALEAQLKFRSNFPNRRGLGITKASAAALYPQQPPSE